MPDNNPLISIIIPTFNRAGLIDKALLSIKNQFYQNWECIVIDDFSIDNTIEAVQKWVDADSRFRLINNQRKKGAQGARNTGILNAKGSWIAFNDSDDEWLPEKLNQQATIIKENSFNPLLVIHSNCIVHDHQSNTNESWNLPLIQGVKPHRKLLNASSPMFQGLITSKVALADINYLDEEVPSYQEWDTAIRLAQHCDFIHFEEPLFIYHKHSEDTISKDMSRDIEGFDYIRVKFREDFSKFYGEAAYVESLINNIGRAARFGCWAIGITLLKKHAAILPPKKCRYLLNCFQNKTIPETTIAKTYSLRHLITRIKRKIYG